MRKLFPILKFFVPVPLNLMKNEVKNRDNIFNRMGNKIMLSRSTSPIAVPILDHNAK